MSLKSLPKELITRENTALSLPPADILNLCLTSKYFNDILCNNEQFWTLKLERDFSGEKLLPIYGNKMKVKNNYKTLFQLQVLSKKLKKWGINMSISELQSLKKLILYDKDIKEIPQEIGQLKSLQILSLGNNLIKEIPPALGQLRSLEKLYLSFNQIKDSSGAGTVKISSNTFSKQ